MLFAKYRTVDNTDGFEDKRVHILCIEIHEYDAALGFGNLLEGLQVHSSINSTVR